MRAALSITMGRQCNRRRNRELQRLGTRAIGGGGGLHQHLPENIAPLVHRFAGGIFLGGVDVNRLAADEAIVFCL